MTAAVQQLDEVLTPSELAQRWGMAVGTLANWRREIGRGPKYIKLGDGPRARVVYRVTDVLAYEQRDEEQT